MSNNPFPLPENSSYPVSDLPRYHQARCIDVGVSRRKLSRQDKRRGEIRKNIESCVTLATLCASTEKKEKRNKTIGIGGWLLGTKVNTKLNRMDARVVQVHTARLPQGNATNNSPVNLRNVERNLVPRVLATDYLTT